MFRNNNKNKSVDGGLLHNTCTSSELPGQDRENLSMDHLNDLVKETFGYEISDNPVVARIQREQAIARSKMSNGPER